MIVWFFVYTSVLRHADSCLDRNVKSNCWLQKNILPPLALQGAQRNFWDIALPHEHTFLSVADHHGLARVTVTEEPSYGNYVGSKRSSGAHIAATRARSLPHNMVNGNKQ